MLTDYLDTAELAKLLRVTPKTIARRGRSDATFPRPRKTGSQGGGRLLWLKSEVSMWIEAQRTAVQGATPAA